MLKIDLEILRLISDVSSRCHQNVDFIHFCYNDTFDLRHYRNDKNSTTHPRDTRIHARNGKLTNEA